jgi:hypothetical protein
MGGKEQRGLRFRPRRTAANDSKREINRAFWKISSSYQLIKSYKHPLSVDWLKRRKAEKQLIEDFSSYQYEVALAARDALNYLAKRWQREKEEPRLSSWPGNGRRTQGACL